MITLNASILFNSNRAVASSEDSWESIREGSFIRFGLDQTFYSVGSVKKLFYIRDFQSGADNIITVSEDTGINLIENDCLKISFKEYELLTVINPISAGMGYKVGDLIYLAGGVPSIETATGRTRISSFRIIETDANGGLLQIRMEERGKYVVAPPEECPVVGSKGAGALLAVRFSVVSNRTMIERTITQISHQSVSTSITLDAPLPNGVIEGKISVDKWELYVTSNYAGESKINQRYVVSRDFTPNLKLPILMQGSFTPEAVYNLAINILDKKIGEMQAQIDKLKS